MKKIILLSAAITLVFLVVNPFMACKKKDGVYKPKEKISKIYYEIVNYDSTGSVPTDTILKKQLNEIWRWEKKKLMQIELRSEAWTWNFVYKGKQVTKIESATMTINFSYKDKSDLEKIEVLDEEGRQLLTVTVNERSDDKITKLTYASYSYDKSLKGIADISNKLQPIMRVMMGDQVGEIISSNIADNDKMHKATTPTTTSVSLSYQGNNVSQAIWTYEHALMPKIYTYSYTYDSKINPYYRAISLMSTQDINTVDISNVPTIAAYYNLFPLSENNITAFESRQDTLVNTIKYDYNYNSEDFPVKQTKIYEGRVNNLERTKFITRYIYHYEYEE
jgi:hypothetical protein